MLVILHLQANLKVEGIAMFHTTGSQSSEVGLIHACLVKGTIKELQVKKSECQ